MRKFFSVFLLFCIFFGAVLNTAEAARFGGGRSFGMQRSVSNFSRLQQPGRMLSQKNPLNTNRWLGPLAGLAAGGLLAYLFMGHGIGSGLLSWLAIFGIGLMLWNFLRSKLQPAIQSSRYNQFNESNVFDARSHSTGRNDYSAGSKILQDPAGFDSETFLRDAKVQFIRLQAAYDAKDLNDLREFTAPEVFAEIQMQIKERGETINQTEVVSLDAELLDVTSESQSTVASVKFSGMIREAANAPAEPFNEAWHFRKNNLRDNWVVIGVQQNIN